MDDYNVGRIIQVIMIADFIDKQEKEKLIEEFLKLKTEKQKIKEIIRDVSLPCPYQHYPPYYDDNGTAPYPFTNPIWLVDFNNPILVN